MDLMRKHSSYMRLDPRDELRRLYTMDCGPSIHHCGGADNFQLIDALDSKGGGGGQGRVL